MDAYLGASIEYSINGTILNYNIPFGITSASISGSTNLFITGSIGGDSSTTSNTDCDAFAASYASNGTVLWETILPSTGYKDVGRTIAVDQVNGWVYTGGYSGIYNQGTISKFHASNGTLIWSNAYDYGQFYIYALALDGGDNVIFTGAKPTDTYAANGMSNGLDILTIKIDTDGNILWQQQVGGIYGGDDVARAIAYDPVSNTVCLTGYTEGILPGNTKSYSDYSTDYFLIKYDASYGTQFFVKQVYDYYWYQNCGVGIALDQSSNMYVVSQWNSGTYTYCVLNKFDQYGEFAWNTEKNTGYLFNYGSGYYIYPYGISRDENGDLIMTGSTWNGGNYDVFLLKRSSTGTYLWYSKLDSYTNDNSYGITFDLSQNSFYITGSTEGSLFETKVDSAAKDLFIAQYYYADPTSAPSNSPTTSAPSYAPTTATPSYVPVTNVPSLFPIFLPTSNPSWPTSIPSLKPSVSPTVDRVTASQGSSTDSAAIIYGIVFAILGIVGSLCFLWYYIRRKGSAPKQTINELDMGEIYEANKNTEHQPNMLSNKPVYPVVATLNMNGPSNLNPVIMSGPTAPFSQSLVFNYQVQPISGSSINTQQPPSYQTSLNHPNFNVADVSAGPPNYQASEVEDFNYLIRYLQQNKYNQLDKACKWFRLNSGNSLVPSDIAVLFELIKSPFDLIRLATEISLSTEYLTCDHIAAAAQVVKEDCRREIIEALVSSSKVVDKQNKFKIESLLSSFQWSIIADKF